MEVECLTRTLAQILDYPEGEARNPNGRSAMAFSIMCMFLSILYAAFAGLTFSLSDSLLEEFAMDEDETPRNPFIGYDGYIGERFDVGSGGFVSPPVDGTLT